LLGANAAISNGRRIHLQMQRIAQLHHGCCGAAGEKGKLSSGGGGWEGQSKGEGGEGEGLNAQENR